LLIVAFILSGFRFGKGKMPILLGLFCLIGVSVVFGIIDSFWVTDYLDKWMNALDYFHENDGGISRYTIVANLFFFIGALLILKQGILVRLENRFHTKRAIVAWALLFLSLHSVSSNITRKANIASPMDQR